MGKYTEKLNLTLTEEQYRRMESAVNEGGYNTKTAYARAMMETGESNIAALDPRTTETDTDVHANHETAKAAANALSDTTLIDQLEQGASNKQEYDESVQELRQKFENRLIERLGELANDPSSPVRHDDRGNYYLEDS